MLFSLSSRRISDVYREGRAWHPRGAKKVPWDGASRNCLPWDVWKQNDGSRKSSGKLWWVELVCTILPFAINNMKKRNQAASMIGQHWWSLSSPVLGSPQNGFFFFPPKGSLKSIPTFKDQRSVHRKEKLNREQVESHRKLKKQYKRNPSVPRGQGCFMGSVRNNFLRVMRSDWWLRKDQGKFDFFF